MWSALSLPGGISSAPKRSQLVAAGRNQANMRKGGEAEPRLSGSDVLMALNRAAANKFKEKAIRIDNDASAPRPAVTAKVKEQSSTVKPLRINSQWEHQLEELETRLHQLLPRA
ncbi:hypothetical protein SASPL_145924 [Salvia splendens]|uniref:Uncharacterized protein n=1 Tax=Salvia splendens TaxID=180675 RepID=A0A8X8Z8J1_SALSN|nr:hypothetical protein SASPL_145924 [Salvia splendens]